MTLMRISKVIQETGRHWMSSVVVGYVAISCSMPFLCRFCVHAPVRSAVSVFVQCLPFCGMCLSLCASANVAIVICVLANKACHICLWFFTHALHSAFWTLEILFSLFQSLTAQEYIVPLRQIVDFKKIWNAEMVFSFDRYLKIENYSVCNQTG